MASIATIAGRLLRPLGLDEPARSGWRRLKGELVARGYMGWTPLVPAESFAAGLRNGLAELLRLDPAPGDYLEFGVSRGTSLACAFHAFRAAGLSARLVGFDSFEGLPTGAATEGWAPGAFRSTRSATVRNLRKSGVDLARVTLVEGWFSATLTRKRERG